NCGFHCCIWSEFRSSIRWRNWPVDRGSGSDCFG
ncbi:arsenical-resistance domain protein, partial [Vibrio parahaemolyticus V-223/04]